MSTRRSWWLEILVGPLLAWFLSRVVLIASFFLARSMRAGLFPLYPQGDPICLAGPCTAASFSGLVLPALGLLVGALSLWVFVAGREDRQAAHWAVWLWLASPMALALQVSAGLAWASALVFLALALAQRSDPMLAAVSLLLGACLAPLTALSSVGVAGVAWQRRVSGGQVAACGAPLLALGILGFALARDAPTQALWTWLPDPLAAQGPGLRELLPVLRLQLLVALVPFSLSLFNLLSERDWPLAAAGVLSTLAGAAVGAPWLGRLTGASVGWSLWRPLGASATAVRGAALVCLGLFQGLLLHFYVHRYPLL